MIFFVNIHPMVIFDTDDWDYIYSIRSLIPEWGNWNPAKLFPEIVMGMVSQVSTVIIYPMSGDYIGALTLGHGIFTSMVILVYVIVFVKLMREKFQLSSEIAISYALLFIVFHFLIFRKNPSGNMHLFYSPNVTCYYNYTIPTLMNCIAVMLFMRMEKNTKMWKEKTMVAKGVFYLFIYLCIFSNLFASVILMAYVGGKLLIVLCKELRNRSFHVITYIKNYRDFLVIFVLWIIQQIFEMNGGRADSISEGSLLQGVLATIDALRRRMYGVNYWFVGIVTVILAVAVFLIINNRKEKETKQVLCEMGQVFLTLSLVMVYLFLLCGRASAGYIMRCDVLVGPAFLGFLLVFIGLITIMKRFPEVNAAIPILIFALFCETNTRGNTFVDMNMGGLSAETCIEIDNDIVEQVKVADESGLYSMKLYVPDFSTEDNWPIAIYGGVSISEALSKHGVIRQPIAIEIVPTKEKNKQFNLLAD